MLDKVAFICQMKQSRTHRVVSPCLTNSTSNSPESSCTTTIQY